MRGNEGIKMIIEVGPFVTWLLYACVYAAILLLCFGLAVGSLLWALKVINDQMATKEQWYAMAYCYWVIVRGKKSDAILAYHEELRKRDEREKKEGRK